MLKEAHKHSSDHRKELSKSKVIGCFYCKKTSTFEEIKEWVNGRKDALCPKCGIDSLIGDASGYKITKRFLDIMHRRWFDSCSTYKESWVGLDRFINFSDKIPTIEELQFIIEDYFSDLAKFEHKLEQKTFYVMIPGKPSNPFRRIVDGMDRQHQPERWIEVNYSTLECDEDESFGPCIDVITRMADHLTNALAEGLAKTIARYYGGKLDE